MTDQFDRAAEVEQLHRDAAIRRHKHQSAVSLLYCEDCGEPIPEQRRRLIQGVTRCIDCQQAHERRQRNYAK